MVPSKVIMTRSEHPCIRCGVKLWQIDPPISGWKYYCQRCKHLTAPPVELAEQWSKAHPEGVGIIVAIPAIIDIVEDLGVDFPPSALEAAGLEEIGTPRQDLVPEPPPNARNGEGKHD